jgi:Ser/Thr protein kinase RdoA (MazF antagonist)
LQSRWEAIHHLLRIGLLKAEDLVDGTIVATEILGRNHLVRIDRLGGCSFTIKQPRDADAPDAQTMWTEAAIFWLSANDQDFARLAGWMPRYFHYHEPDKLLTIEYIVAGDSLMAKQMAGPLAPGLLYEVGRAFGTLHGPVSRALVAKPESRLFSPMLPWALALGSAATRYMPPSPAAAAIHAEVMRRPDALAALAQLRGAWRSHQVIHGDAKAANILILDDGSIRVIDWEIAGLGDGLWDLAGLVHSLIVPNPMTPAEPLAVAAARASKSIEALSAGYRAGDPLLPGLAGSRDAVLRMTGARIIQTCLESAHAATQVSNALPPLLQIALELLSRPGALGDQWRWAA